MKSAPPNQEAKKRRAFCLQLRHFKQSCQEGQRHHKHNRARKDIGMQWVYCTQDQPKQSQKPRKGEHKIREMIEETKEHSEERWEEREERKEKTEERSEKEMREEGREKRDE